MEFRSDINALRAIAVLAVCLFHFSVPGFAGGFAGVDVFFVISGYLMTRIIISKLDTGSFSLMAFYQARGVRIIPALAVLCITTLVLGWFLLENLEYQTLGKHVAGAMGFFSNILFQSEAGYFDQMSHKKWLLHTWSLSVEWQFYLLYPLLLLLTSNTLKRIHRPQFLRWIVLAAALFSMAWCVLQTQTEPSAAFYGLTQRAWEMLAGAIVFLFPHALTDTKSDSSKKKWIAGIGLALIAGSIHGLDGNLAWPGWWAQIPVMGCALVIWSQANINVFNFAPVQRLGRISYSVYLWHWPLFVLLNYYGKQQSAVWITGTLFLSIALATVSYTWVESKCGKQLGRARKPWLYLLITCLLVAVLGRLIVKLDGIPGATRAINNSESALFLKHYAQLHLHGLHGFYRLECDFYDADTKLARTTIPEHCTPKSAAGGVFLWGDSHAQALSHGIMQTLPKGQGFAQVATSGCRPSLKPQLHRTGIDNNCEHSNRYALQAIAELRPVRVLLAQEAEHEQTDWQELAGHLQSLGVREVVLVGPVPQWRPSLPQVIVSEYWGDTRKYVGHGLDVRITKTDAVLKERFKNSSKLNYISLFDALCTQQACLARVPGSQILMVVDYGHLTPEASVFVVSEVIVPRLRPEN